MRSRRSFARTTDLCERGAYLDSDWFGQMDQVHHDVAKLINCESEEVALVKNTSEAVSTVALGLDWQVGDKVITADVEYPANIYPWMEAARKHGIELVMVPEETDEHGRRQVRIEKILTALDQPRVRLLTLSHVEFASGQRHDLIRLGKVCRERGILFNVDGIQSLGALPVDVKAMNIDFLGACGHKWMCGPPGAGLFYIRRELQDRVRPIILGANSVINDMDYGNYDFTFKTQRPPVRIGNPEPGRLLRVRSGSATADLPGDRHDRPTVEMLGDRVIAGLELKGYQIVSPRMDDAWSGMVCFTSTKHPHETVVNNLRKDHRIEIALREKRLRCSPHFYNTESQVDAFIDAMPGH